MDDLRDDDDFASSDGAWWSRFAAGFAAAIALDAATIGVAWLAPVIASPFGDAASVVLIASYVWTFTFGVLQFVYIVPLAGFLWISDQKALATGIAAGAGGAFLLSGLFYGCLVGAFGGVAAWCSTQSMDF